MLLNILIIVFTILALILAAKNNWWTWPLNMISASILMYFFFKDAMYISFLNNLYTAIISFITCFTWKRNSSENALEIKKFNIEEKIKWFLFTGGAILLFWCLNHCISSYPIFDAIGVAMFVIGTYLLSKHYYEAWILYLIGDLSYILVGLISGNFIYPILYTLMVIVDYYGLTKYKNQLI